MPTEKPKVFLCYARADSKFALKLANDLRSASANIWIDQLDIPAGEDWDSVTEKALEICDCLLTILSPNSVQSREVRNELNYALEEKKRIIPVLYKEVKIPYRLRLSQRIDFSGEYEQGFKALLGSLNIEIPASTHAEKKETIAKTEQDEPKLDSLEIQEPAPPPKEEKDNTSDESRDEKEAKPRTGREQTATKAQPVQEQKEKPSPREQSRKTRFRFNKKRFGIGSLLGVLLFSVVSIWRGWIDLSLYLSDEEAATMIVDKGFYDRERNQEGEGVKNQYTPITVGTDKTVADGATGLTWQQSGLPESVLHKEAQKYTQELRDKKYAGFSDWRLPTLEEAMSLMEPKKNEHGLHINPIFDKKQLRIWTADKEDALQAWGVDFSYGFCGSFGSGYFIIIYVRAVR